ncbi:ASKHA domain-containing protein [Amphritea sp. HPY]|uniref:ASKHA domain-containing protein n=1 Tax=Amphritea sp. HPY TaxID=3421652 RepID=UPI003D7DA7FC
MSDIATVVFTPTGLRGEFPVGTSVLQAAQQLGVDLESSCGGRGVCGRCQVMHSVGEFPKHGITSLAEHLTPPTEREEGKNNEVLRHGRRLGCSARILGDMVVDVPSDSQIHKQHIVKEATAVEIDHDPAVKLFTVQVPPPNMDEPQSDLRRVQQMLLDQHQVQAISTDLSVLQALQPALDGAERQLTVAVYHDTEDQNQIIAVWPGTKERVYGLAVDLGSTTVAAHLCDLTSLDVVSSSSVMNPQIRFGEDLMSRVSYVMMNEGGDREMTQAVRQAFNEMAKDAAGKAGIELEDILELTVVCNPIMHHLFLGIDPTPLGSAPFALATDRPVTVRSAELEIHLHPQARCFVLPCIAGHIGADTAGVILAERPDQADEITLIVDVGTNAEVVLGNKDRLLAASSPTGPAFEGAQISCGQRAAAGAIERVRIDPVTLEPRFKVIGCDLWSDDPEFTIQTRKIGISGVCGSGIIEVLAELFLAGVIDSDGVIDPAMAEKSPRIVPNGRTFSYVLYEGAKTLSITQNDVRAIQLAKAALYAGTQLLLDHMGISKVDRISLAGAFGSHIDVKYAMVLGLIPDCDLQKVGPVGNAAGTGARIALLDRSKRNEIEQVLRRVEKIETATEAKFQDHFVQSMAFPHLTDQFVELAKEVQLPERRVVNAAGGSRGAGRGRRRVRRAS